MAKQIRSGGPRDPLQNTRARHVGQFYQRVTPHSVVIQSWPRKRRSWKNPTNLVQRSTFKQMVEDVKNMPADHVAFAYAAAKGSGYAPRDILSLLWWGRWLELKGPQPMPIQADLDSLSDVFGALIVRDLDIWIGLNPGAPGQVLTIAPSGGPQWITPAAPGASRGLFSALFSTLLPTIVGTGLGTWFNQGTSTIADTDAGVFIDHPATAGSPLTGRKTSSAGNVKTTIFTSTLNVVNGFVFLGWTDGTKFHILCYFMANNLLRVDQWASATVFNAAGSSKSGLVGYGIWLQIEQTSTTVFFRYSIDGANWVTLFSVAKSAGYLGSSGYSSICWGVRGDAVNRVNATLQSFS